MNAYRLNSKITEPKKIVTVLNSKQSKNDFITNSKKLKLSGNLLTENWNNDAIYVNNCLTYFNRNFYFKTKAFARDGSYKFVWFKDSKLFIKK